MYVCMYVCMYVHECITYPSSMGPVNGRSIHGHSTVHTSLQMLLHCTDLLPALPSSWLADDMPQEEYDDQRTVLVCVRHRRCVWGSHWQGRQYWEVAETE